jgi:hypothetical protein
MDDIKNTILLLNGNIDSSTEYSKEQIGDQSGNFWISKNEHVSYSTDILNEGASEYHKSISVNDNSKLELVDTRHLFNFGNREFSIDAWVKFDEEQSHIRKDHTIIAKWNETGSPADTKLFKFYYSHVPTQNSDIEEHTIEISSTTHGFEFNGEPRTELNFTHGKIYNLIFDVNMWISDTLLPTPSTTETATLTDEVGELSGLPSGVTFECYETSDVSVFDDVIDEQDAELPYNELANQWDGVQFPNPPHSQTETASSDDQPTETNTETDVPNEESAYGILGQYITEIPNGIQLDLTSLDSEQLQFTMAHTYTEEQSEVFIPEIGVPTFGLIDDDVSTDIYADYMEYYKQFPISQTSTETVEEPLAYVEWLSQFNYQPTATETYDAVPTSTSTTNLVDINNTSTIKIEPTETSDSNSSKLIFEYNGLKGYKSEYRDIRLSKSFYHDGVEYDAPDTFEPTRFVDITISDEHMSVIPDELSNLLSDKFSKVWIGEYGLVIYPIFTDYAGFYQVRTDIKVPPTQPPSTQTETQSPPHTQTTTPSIFNVDEYQDYLNTNVERTFKFIPIESYNEITGELIFKSSESGDVTFTDITECVGTGIVRELDVENLIDGEWHHVYFSTSSPPIENESAFNERVTFGLDGNLTRSDIDYFRDDSLAYIQYKHQLSKKIKLTSVQPFFEAADFGAPYNKFLTIGITSIGHDNSTNGNNLNGLIDSLRVNEFETFESDHEYYKFYTEKTAPNCFLFVEGIAEYTMFDENTQYDFSVGPLAPRITLSGVVRYTEVPTTPFEALKTEMGSIAYLKRIIGHDFSNKSTEEIESILEEWRWKLKFISPSFDLRNAKEVAQAYEEYADEFYTGEALYGGE